MTRYRYLPTDVDAFRWTGVGRQTDDPEWIVEAIKDGMVEFFAAGSDNIEMHISNPSESFNERAYPGDWIVHNRDDDIWPLTDEEFKATFREITDDTA